MSTTTTSSDSSLIWRTALRHAALAYTLSRLCVLIGAAIVGAEMRADDNKLRERLIWGFFGKPDPHARDAILPRSASSMILDVLTSWDGIWYMRIVRRGYPEYVPSGITYDDPEARVAFFPMYPWLVRTVDRVLPGGDTFAALFVNLVLGAVFIVLVGLLARRWFGDRAARPAMVLTAFFPGSFVLSFAYSEALLLVLAAACLLALSSERWVMAGVFAAVATATRPNGIALVAAAAIAAAIAIRRSRQWWALSAPLLSPLGFLAYQWWIDRHTGESRVWFRVQGEAWKEGASFGLTAIRNTLEAFTKPLTSPTDLITAVAFLATIAVVWLAWKRPLPLPAVAYSAVVVALMLLPSTVTARPRFLFTAFPLVVAAAVWLDDERRRHWWPYLLAACGTGLTALTALYGVYGAIP
ncbi:MAG: glycosyltransferase family 39 protein [Ilumatobacteraceae bacterium]